MLDQMDSVSGPSERRPFPMGSRVKSMLSRGTEAGVSVSWLTVVAARVGTPSESSAWGVRVAVGEELP